MRTRDEQVAGDYVWTAFPLNPRVPPSFPLAGSQIWAKRLAGVAELVDALDLGSGPSSHTFKALASFRRVLWVKLRKTPQNAMTLTQTSIGAYHCGD